MPKCKLCGKEITFVRTAAGKSLPCEPKLIHYYQGKGQKIVTIEGNVVECSYIGINTKPLGMGFVPHWGNCSIQGKKKKALKPEIELFK